MEPNIESLKLKRTHILEDILKRIKDWDKTYEAGIKIIDRVDLSLEELKEINTYLETQLGFVPFDEPYEEGIRSLKEDYKILLDELEIEKANLLELIKEIRLKEKVKNSYILQKNNSIFIDKDL